MTRGSEFSKTSCKYIKKQVLKMSQNVVAVAIAALSLLNYSVAGQSALASAGQPAAPPNDATNSYGMAAQGNRWTMGASLDYSYVGGGDISFQGIKGNSDAQSFNANVAAEIPVNDKWFVPVGIGSRNLFLGTVANAPIPDQINTLGFNAGVGYRFNDQWTFAGSVGPRFYRLDGVDGDDVGVSGMFRATYKWKPNLTLGFGIGFEPDSQVPVLPAAGLRWDIRTNLTLNLMWPRPALIYRVDNQFEVFVAGGGNFTVFRTDQNLGDKIGQPAFDHALGTYRDFHIGAGAEYRLVRGLSIGVEGGYSLGREIDYTRIDQTLSFGSSPYFQVGLKYRF
jgi:opacity protein-like surface antigen